MKLNLRKALLIVLIGSISKSQIGAANVNASVPVVAANPTGQIFPDGEIWGIPGKEIAFTASPSQIKLLNLGSVNATNGIVFRDVRIANSVVKIKYNPLNDQISLVLPKSPVAPSGIVSLFFKDRPFANVGIYNVPQQDVEILVLSNSKIANDKDAKNAILKNIDSALSLYISREDADRVRLNSLQKLYSNLNNSGNIIRRSESIKTLGISSSGAKVCGKWITSVSGIDDAFLGILKESGLLVGDNTDIKVDPTGSLIPSAESKNIISFPSDETDKKQWNRVILSTIGLNDKFYEQFRIKNFDKYPVFILDTSQASLDNYTANGRVIFHNSGPVNYKVINHGYPMGQIINMVSQSRIKAENINVCNERNCSVMKIVEAICSISNLAEENESSPVINLSMGSLDESVILRDSILDGLSSNVSFVVSSGNSDSCPSGIQICAHYPASSPILNAMEGFYSVGSMSIVYPWVSISTSSYDRNGKNITKFKTLASQNNLLSSSMGSRIVVSAPRIYAPGYFYLRNNKGEYRFYGGTSFSAPVVSTAIALYRSCVSRGILGPKPDDIGRSISPILNLSNLLSFCMN